VRRRRPSLLPPREKRRKTSWPSRKPASPTPATWTDTFLSASRSTSIKSGDFNRVPFMTGSNKDEFNVTMILVPGAPLVSKKSTVKLLRNALGPRANEILAMYDFKDYRFPCSCAGRDRRTGSPPGPLPRWEAASRPKPRSIFTASIGTRRGSGKGPRRLPTASKIPSCSATSGPIPSTSS